MEIIRISAAGIACVLAAIFMKTAKPEYSVYLTMAAGLFILAFAVGKFSYLYESLKKIQQYVPVDTTYMNILMKMIVHRLLQESVPFSSLRGSRSRKW